MKSVLPKYFSFILASLVAISPLAIDAYLPAILSISSDLNTDIGSVEATLSIYLLGLSLGQLVGGPLSDRYGRKIIIDIGLSFYILFSILIALSASIEQMWVYRFFQAVGGGFAIVNMGAIIRDNFDGKESAKVLSFVAMIMMVAPMIAPTIGTLILTFFSWEYIFYFLSLYAFLVILWIQKLPETSPKTKEQNVARDYFLILSNKIALFLAFSSAFAMAGMFVFITKSSFIYMDFFKLDKNLFTLFFGMNVLMLMGFNRLNISLLNKFDRKHIVISGIFVQIFAACVLILNALLLPSLFITVIGLMAFVGSLGLIFGNVISLVLGFFPKISATANAVVGVLGFATSAVMGFLATLIPQGNLYLVFVFMALCALIAMISFSIAKKEILSTSELSTSLP